jgi:RNA 2',3'-cyclic 3'-phosphodiesterase
VRAVGQPLRLFFALWPDDRTRAALAERGEELHRVTGGRATRPESLHITLAFLGDCDPARCDAVQAAAARVRPRPFELVLDRAGLWVHNRIAWLGASEMPPELEVLVQGLRSALADAGVAFDGKPFVPHITLARKVRPGSTLPALSPVRWPVAGFALVQSVLDRGGSNYAVLARWS